MPEFNPDAEVRASVATGYQTLMFILASGITDPKRQRALLEQDPRVPLYQAGPRVREIFKQLHETGDESAYDTAKAKLKNYFEPQKNRPGADLKYVKQVARRSEIFTNNIILCVMYKALLRGVLCANKCKIIKFPWNENNVDQSSQ